ncbi:hypothetical protein NLG97_g1568 [Lecanicillium saksenae]|uniref:Uncharacterized protein n=1 Tax=Lecanicillium saksenae TaxID=468837 RepID=A0ACC1R3E5_9HYPO|nr:hypothetical protein NLG97_g1568 [Lecanicillium saksenae]
MGKPEINESGSFAATDLSPVSESRHAKTQPMLTELIEVEDFSSSKPRSLVIGVPEGITRIETITRSWNRYALAGVYFTLWGAYLIFAFQRAFAGNIGPYALSSFGEHSLLPSISLVSNIMSGVVYLPMAKAVNIYGRAESHIAMALVSATGLVLLAASQNIEAYSAGVILTEVGLNGLIYAVDIITADTSMLKSRALAYAFTATPFIITAFGGPAAAQSLLPNAAESQSQVDATWRWSFGSLAICLPIIALPLYGILFFYERRGAAQSGSRQEQLPREQPATVGRRILETLVKFDVLGIVVLAAGQILFLLPFSLAASSERQWASGHIIAMIILGIVFLAAFPLVEKRFSPQPFISWRLLTDRTLLLVCAIDALFLFSNGTYQSYFVSYLQVVYDLSVSHAGYIDGITSVVSGIWKLLIGVLIRRTGDFKWPLAIGLAVHALFLGLLIYFRHPDTATGLLVMCQLILGFASGTIVLCLNVGVVATVEHADIAATVALLGVSSYIGSAVGAAVSGAIWTNLFPGKLQQLLPDSVKGDAMEIYGSLQRQLSFPPGSAARIAIAQTYASTQAWMLTAGTLVAVIALILALALRSIKLAERGQVVGVTL